MHVMNILRKENVHVIILQKNIKWKHVYAYN